MDLLLSTADPARIRAAVHDLLGPSGQLWFGRNAEELLTLDGPCTAVLLTSSDTPGFPTALSFAGILASHLGLDRPAAPHLDPSSAQVTAFLQRLAFELSRRLDGEVLVEATGHAPSKSPYWSILWRSGRAFLADDSGIDADPPEPPGVVGELALDGARLLPELVVPPCG
jgi:hypothetical protein